MTVTYAETMAFYKENKDRLSNIPDAVAVGQIIKYPSVTPESRAQSLALIQQIQGELRGGADFAELARKYSQDPGSARAGGDLGYVQKVNSSRVLRMPLICSRMARYQMSLRLAMGSISFRC